MPKNAYSKQQMVIAMLVSAILTGTAVSSTAGFAALSPSALGVDASPSTTMTAEQVRRYQEQMQRYFERIRESAESFSLPSLFESYPTQLPDFVQRRMPSSLPTSDMMFRYQEQLERQMQENVQNQQRLMQSSASMMHDLQERMQREIERRQQEQQGMMSSQESVMRMMQERMQRDAGMSSSFRFQDIPLPNFQFMPAGFSSSFTSSMMPPMPYPPTGYSSSFMSSMMPPMPFGSAGYSSSFAMPNALTAVPLPQINLQQFSKKQLEMIEARFEKQVTRIDERIASLDRKISASSDERITQFLLDKVDQLQARRDELTDTISEITDRISELSAQ